MIPVRSRWRQRQECWTYLKALARLIAADQWKEFDARAYDGVPIEQQVRWLRDRLNATARPADSFTHMWTSDMTPDMWYVDWVQEPDGTTIFEMHL